MQPSAVGSRVVQRHVLYLGEINDSQELAWRKSIEAIEERAPHARTLSLFPEDRCEGLIDDGSIVRLKLKEMRLSVATTGFGNAGRRTLYRSALPGNLRDAKALFRRVIEEYVPDADLGFRYGMDPGVVTAPACDPP
jgi:hypothetical protein